MTEPLVTRKKYGIPYLRGTPLSPSALQSWMDVGLSTAKIRARWPRLLGGWPDEDIERALTYPRVGMDVKSANCRVKVDGIGSIAIDGWFDVSEVDDVIAVLEQAREAVEAWGRACDEWETS